MHPPARRKRRIALAAGLALLAASAYGLARRTRPAPGAPAPLPPEPPQAPAPQRRGVARRRLVAGLSVAALSFAGAAFSAEPVVPERWIPRPAIAAPAARPLPVRALVRHRHRLRHRLRQRPQARRRAHHPLSLAERVLRDPRIRIYPGGRADIALGRVDGRILRVLLYLARLDHEVTVSSLISGHRYWARPGVVSTHIYGRAVDIAALDGVPVAGHQYNGSLTEQTVRALVRLPPRLRPRQIISGFELGGPSLDLPGHSDHIHVGY